MDDVKADRKLNGKTNFMDWKREFKSAAKINAIFEYLTSEGVVSPKPRKEDYFARPVVVETRRCPARAKKTAQTATQTTGDGVTARHTEEEGAPECVDCN